VQGGIDFSEAELDESTGIPQLHESWVQNSALEQFHLSLISELLFFCETPGSRMYPIREKTNCCRKALHPEGGGSGHPQQGAYTGMHTQVRHRNEFEHTVMISKFCTTEEV
jgi:hypothetical protein